MLYLKNEFMNSADFLHADCDAIILVSLTLYSISTSVVLVSQKDPVVYPGVYLGIGSLDFFEFWHGARNSYVVARDRTRVFGKTFFAPKTGEMGQK